MIGTQAGPNADTGVGPASAEQPQIENDGSPFVDPTNSFTDTTTGQTSGYQSALGGILAQAGSHMQVSYSPGSVDLAEQPALQATGATSGPGAITTPDGCQPGFLATYFGGDDPTDPAAPVLGTQTVPLVHYNGTGGPTGPASIPAVPNGSPAVTIPTQYQDNQWSVSYRGTYVPPSTGDYNFSVAESGTTKLYVNGQLVEQRLRDDFGYIDHTTAALRAERPVSIVLDYSPMAAAASNTPPRASLISTRSSVTRSTSAPSRPPPGSRARSTRRCARRGPRTSPSCSPGGRSARATTSRALISRATRTS